LALVDRWVGDEGTEDTVPRHIFMHEVELRVAQAVPRLEADFFRTPSVRDLMSKRYNAGEPMWMVAHEMASMGSDYSLGKRQARFERSTMPTGANLRSMRARMELATPARPGRPSLPPGTKRG
jgi:hypothetical protein